MLWLNRVLNILLLIFAIASLVFGYLLFERRKGLRIRGEKLADAIFEVTKALDENSGTKLQDSVHRKDFETADGKNISGGTLGWAYFHESHDSQSGTYPNFDKILEQVNNQTQDLRSQRDALASTLAEIATLFEQKEIDVSTFQDVTKFDQAQNNLLEDLRKAHKHNDAFISKIEELSKKIGVPINRADLYDPDKFEEPLIQLGMEVTQLRERMVNFIDTLSQSVTRIDTHDFETDPAMLDDPTEYAGQLTTLLNDFASINDKLKDYEQYKVEFIEAKDTLEKTRAALESSHDNLAALENKLATLEAENASVNARYNRLVGDTTKTEDPKLQKLEGKILDVDYDWNYVVLDLGTNDNLPENLEMTVAREQEYICKVLVTKVYKDYAVAEILPKLKEGNVIEGDRVIF